MKSTVLLFTFLMLANVVCSAQETANTAYDVAPWPLPGHRPQPEFPQVMWFSGRTIAVLSIDSLGEVANINILRERPEDSGMDSTVRAALEKWVYSPALKNGRPVAALDTVEFTFEVVSTGEMLWDSLGNLKRSIWARLVPESLIPAVDSTTTIGYEPPPILRFFPLKAPPASHIFPKSDLFPKAPPYDRAPWPMDGMHSQPSYPELMLITSESGYATVVASIDTAGNVTDVVVTRENPRTLSPRNNVVEAVSTWKYIPATLNGQAVASTDTLMFRFIMLRRDEELDKYDLESVDKSYESIKRRFIENDSLATYQPPPIFQIAH